MGVDRSHLGGYLIDPEPAHVDPRIERLCRELAELRTDLGERRKRLLAIDLAYRVRTYGRQRP